MSKEELEKFLEEEKQRQKREIDAFVAECQEDYDLFYGNCASQIQNPLIDFDLYSFSSESLQRVSNEFKQRLLSHLEKKFHQEISTFQNQRMDSERSLQLSQTQTPEKKEIISDQVNQAQSLPKNYKDVLDRMETLQQLSLQKELADLQEIEQMFLLQLQNQ